MLIPKLKQQLYETGVTARLIFCMQFYPPHATPILVTTQGVDSVSTNAL